MSRLEPVSEPPEIVEVLALEVVPAQWDESKLVIEKQKDTEDDGSPWAFVVPVRVAPLEETCVAAVVVAVGVLAVVNDVTPP
jgi:hypothetical protein